jgi:hypothetical protein
MPGKSLAQGRRLCAAGIGQRDVGEAGMPSVTGPLRLAVAHQPELSFGLRHQEGGRSARITRSMRRSGTTHITTTPA